MRFHTHRRAGRWPAAIAMAGVATLLAATAGTVQAGPVASTRPATPAAPAAAAATPVATGATDIANLGAGGWEVQSSAVATQTGGQISTPGFSTSGWLPVTNDDAGAPGTEIEALAQNGKCPGDTALQPVNLNSAGTTSAFYSNNMKLCYGYETAIGPDTVTEFDVPWWWRTDFTASPASGKYGSVIVNGVVGSANVWVNGTEVATSATVTGAYTKFTFNVSSLLVS